jgi:hypothetical protein
MEKTVILQVALNENDSLEIQVGGANKFPPLMLVGILEQVKMQILTDMDNLSNDDPTPKQYDA